MSLIMNAIKFTLEGSVKVRIDYSKSTNILVTQVEDTGVGISDTDKESLF